MSNYIISDNSLDLFDCELALYHDKHDAHIINELAGLDNSVKKDDSAEKDNSAEKDDSAEKDNSAEKNNSAEKDEQNQDEYKEWDSI